VPASAREQTLSRVHGAIAASLRLLTDRTVPVTDRTVPVTDRTVPAAQRMPRVDNDCGRSPQNGALTIESAAISR